LFLLILDKNPYKAAEYLIEHTNKSFVFKSLLQLGQLICSAGISDVFKQGRELQELQEWVKKYHFWIITFYARLFRYIRENFNLKESTMIKFLKIQGDLSDYYFENKCRNRKPQTAIFHYIKEYSEFTEYESNSELPIDAAISEYKRYLKYKEEQYNKKRCKK